MTDNAILRVGVDSKGAVVGSLRAEAALERLRKKALQVEGTTLSLARAQSRLGIAFAAITAGFIVGGIAKLSDSYTTVQNRLKLVTSSSEELAATTKKILDLANDTRAPFESTARLFTQLSLNASQLGLSEQEVIDRTSTLNKIIALTGQSAAASSNALIQLQQAFGAGVLRGDELRSVMEQLPLLSQIIANKLKIPIGQLKEFGQTGGITAQILSDALGASAEEIDEAFKNTTFTFGQAGNIFINNVTNMVGKFNEATGVFEKGARAIAYLGIHLLSIAKAATAAAISFALFRASGFIAWLFQANRSLVIFRGGLVFAQGSASNLSIALQTLRARILGAAVAMIRFTFSNPFTIIAYAVVAILPLLALFSDQINVGADAGTKLSVVLSGAWNFIKAGIIGATNLFIGFLNLLGFTVPTVASVTGAIGAFLTGLGTVFAGYIGFIDGSIRALFTLASETIPFIYNGFVQLWNGLVSVFQAFIDKLVTIYNASPLAALFGESAGVDVSGAKASTTEGPTDFTEFGELLTESFTQGFTDVSEAYEAIIASGNATANTQSESSLKDIFVQSKGIEQNTAKALDYDGKWDDKLTQIYKQQTEWDPKKYEAQIKTSDVVVSASKTNAAEIVQGVGAAVKEVATAVKDSGGSDSGGGGTKVSLPVSVGLSSGALETGTTNALNASFAKLLSKTNLQLSKGLITREQANELITNGRAAIEAYAKGDPTGFAKLGALGIGVQNLVDRMPRVLADELRTALDPLIQAVFVGLGSFATILGGIASATIVRQLREAFPLLAGGTYGYAGGFGIGGFASGTDFVVPGRGSRDTKRATLDLTPGERVRITPKGQRDKDGSGSAANINVNLFVQGATDVDSFRKTRAQLESELASAVRGAYARAR